MLLTHEVYDKQEAQILVPHQFNSSGAKNVFSIAEHNEYNITNIQTSFIANIKAILI